METIFVMGTLKKLWNQVRPYANKYVITIIIFVVLIVFVEDDNVIKRISYNSKISDLEDEIEYYKSIRNKSEKEIKYLNASDDELEKIAREQYLMKKPNEEIYIIKK